MLGRLDALLIGSTDGAALAAVWRGWPVDVGAHAYKDGVELRASWTRHFPLSTLTLDGGVLTNERLFANATFSARQYKFRETLHVAIDDDHVRAIARASFRGVSAQYQLDRGEEVALGGLATSILPRSAYALRILDPALPVAILSGEDYDGWRVETTVPSMPFTAFYQRHRFDHAQLSLAGAQIAFHSDANPILKTPALDVTVGAAYILDEPLRGDTQWWVGMRWRP